MNKRLTLLAMLSVLVIGGIISSFFSDPIQNALTLKMPAISSSNTTDTEQKKASQTPMGPTVGSQHPTPSIQAQPMQVNALAQDTFQRNNQQLWGNASDGNSWGGDANTIGVFSINNATGQIAHGNGAVDATLGPEQSNVDVLIRGSVNYFGSGANLGVVLRWSNAQNWYKAFVDGQSLTILKSVKGVSSQLRTIPFAAQGGRMYAIRFRAIGAMLFVRAWRSDMQEPNQWMIVTSDLNLTSGKAGIRVVLVPDTVMSMTSFVTTPAHLPASL